MITHSSARKYSLIYTSNIIENLIIDLDSIHVVFAYQGCESESGLCNSTEDMQTATNHYLGH